MTEPTPQISTTQIDESIARDMLHILNEHGARHGEQLLVETYPHSALIYYLKYLRDLEFIELCLTPLSGGEMMIEYCEILAPGISYIGRDGGMYQRANTVTIAFNEKTLKAIITANIQDSDMSESEKQKLITHVKGLPREALSTLSEHLVQQAIHGMTGLAQELWLLLGLGK